MKEMVRIEGRELRRIDYKGQRVITLGDVDDVHGRKGAAKHSFFRHQSRYNEGVDYFRIPYSEWKDLVVNNINHQKDTTVNNINHRQSGGYKGEMVFLTQQGYCKVIKPFNDDKAWQIQQMLINNYFKPGEEASRSSVDSCVQEEIDDPNAWSDAFPKIMYHEGHMIHVLDFPPYGEVCVVAEVGRALGKSRSLLREKSRVYPEVRRSIHVLRGAEYSRFHKAFKHTGAPMGGNSISICKLEMLPNLLLYGNAGKEELALWKTVNSYLMGTRPAVAMVPVYRDSVDMGRLARV